MLYFVNAKGNIAKKKESAKVGRIKIIRIRFLNIKYLRDNTMWNGKKLTIIKLLISLMLFYGAMIYEKPAINRLYVYMIIYGLYVLINIIRFKANIKTGLLLTFIIEIGLIYLLESKSRYLINYYFHLFYIFIFIQSFISLKSKDSIIIGSIGFFVSILKFIVLLYYKPTMGNISQSGFFIITNIFIILLVKFVTFYKEEKENKEKLYEELLIANETLREYSRKIEELAIIEERNRIARDLHDTIGHSMTGVIMGMEIVDELIEEDIDKAREMVKYLKGTARDNLVKVREVVETLKSDDDISKGVESIQELIDSFTRNSNVDIIFAIEGERVKVTPDINIALYRAIQEGLTNGVRHGQATEFNITLKYEDDFIELFMKDNGTGATTIEKGQGLKGMEERFLSLGGEVKFYSEDGFILRGNIPLEVVHSDQCSNS